MKPNKSRKLKLSTLLMLLKEDVDVKQLVEKVAFNEAELISAAFEQPILTKAAHQLRVQCMHRRAALEQKINLRISMIGQKYRNVRNSKGRRENTEGAVKAYAEMQPSVIKLRKRLNIAYAREELAKGLIDVFRTRKDMIRVIVDAGRVSVQEKELALLTGNKKLRSAVRNLMNRHSINEI